MIALVVAIFCLLGLIMYLTIKTWTEGKEVGRIMFAMAFLVLMFHVATRMVKLF